MLLRSRNRVETWPSILSSGIGRCDSRLGLWLSAEGANPPRARSTPEKYPQPTTTPTPLPISRPETVSSGPNATPPHFPPPTRNITPPAMPAPKPTPAKPPSSAAAYLFLYNFASSLAWGAVLSRAITYSVADGPEAVYPAVGKFTRVTQTMACMEVLHSLFGRSHLPTSNPLPHATPHGAKQREYEREETNDVRPRSSAPLHDPHADRLSDPPRLGRHLPLP